MKNEQAICVFIVDDHQVVLDCLCNHLASESDIWICGTAENGLMAIEKLGDINADVVLLDINMPRINGIETCKKLKELFPDLAILGLSTIQETSLIKQMQLHGALGCVLKNVGKEELVQAIRSVANGEVYKCGERSDLSSNKPFPKTMRPFPPLSRRESEVLRLILEEYTTKEIAEQLYISFATVESHRHNLLAKLGVRNTAGLVRVALSYQLMEDSIQEV